MAAFGYPKNNYNYMPYQPRTTMILESHFILMLVGLQLVNTYQARLGTGH